MLEKKVLFEYSHNAIYDNQGLWIIFLDAQSDKTPPLTKKELFLKVGEVMEPTNFEFEVIESSKDYLPKIKRIDDIKFVTDAMKISKELRCIDDIIYKRVDNIDFQEGEYVIAHDEKPDVRIIIDPKRDRWKNKPMIFESYDGKGSFRHIPVYGESSNHIEIELSVKNKEEYKVFVDMYNKVLEQYNNSLKVLKPLSSINE